MLHWETQFVHHSIKWKSIFERKMRNNVLEENRNIIKFTQRRRKKLTRKIFLKVQGWSTILGEIKGNADRLNFHIKTDDLKKWQSFQSLKLRKFRLIETMFPIGKEKIWMNGIYDSCGVCFHFLYVETELRLELKRL